MSKQLGKGPGTPVEFVGDELSLDIPGDALKEEGWKKEGWQMNAMNAPVVSNPPASKTLKEKFKEKSWLEPTDDRDDDGLVTLVLNRIEHDINQFEEFIKMLKDIEGTDLIVGILTGMNMHVVLSF